jgi:protein-glucosylgalactosylhydroxylysine glucosidase
MGPSLLLLQPSIVAAVLQYRTQRLGAAQQRAGWYSFDGAMWPWESAYTGTDCVVWPPNPEGIYEHHISGDVAMAYRQYWIATRNDTWLADAAWPVANATCAFWACRFIRQDAPQTGHWDLVGTADGGQAGAGAACGDKTVGTGNWTIRRVQPPDESAGIVDDSAYTNAVAAATLQWCTRSAGVLGLPVPQLWDDIPRALYLPLNDTLFAGRPVHPEYTGA